MLPPNTARKKHITPEEAIEALTRYLRDGKVSRGLLRELIKLGLEEQKRWKTTQYLKKGRLDLGAAAKRTPPWSNNTPHGVPPKPPEVKGAGQG